MILLFLMSVARYAKSPQDKYAVSFANFLKNELSYEADVLHADRHESLFTN